MFSSCVPSDRYGIIYVITHRKSGKQYVGQTVKSIAKRWSCHLSDSRKGPYPINRAINKYGQDAFVVEIVDWAFSQDELNYREEWWITFLETIRPIGYNIRAGGCHAPMSAETRHKISQSLRGNIPYNKGAPRPKALCQKQSVTMKALYASGKVSSPTKGVKFGPERLAQMRQARLGKPLLAKRKPLLCVETGQVFDGLMSAAAHFSLLRGIKFTTARAALRQALTLFNKNGTPRGTYGYHWRYV